MEVALVASAGENLHANWIADRNVGIERLIDAATYRASRVSPVFDPRRGVAQDQLERPVRMSSRSPSQPEPRSARAPPRSRGSAASVRKAKFTASRFVDRW